MTEPAADLRINDSDIQKPVHKTDANFYIRGESHATVIQDQPYSGPGQTYQPWSQQEKRPGTMGDQAENLPTSNLTSRPITQGTGGEELLVEPENE